MRIFQEARSTNDVIRLAGLHGGPAGLTAIADHQLAGRGRFGRTWEAPAGMALLVSVLIRPGPDGDPEAMGVLPLRVGMAVARALDASTGIRATLKWPNDVLAGRAKLAGILCEAAADFVVAGIGINVHQQGHHFPAELRGEATSAAMVTGHTCSRARLAGTLIAELRPLFTAPHRPLATAELAEFAARDALAGHPITIDGTSAGTATGIDPLGALLVRDADGVHALHSGTVRIAIPDTLP